MTDRMHSLGGTFRVCLSDAKMYHTEENTQEEFCCRVYLICKKPKEKGGKHMANVTQFNRSNAGDAILLDIQGLQDALQCGRGTALKIAKEAEAEIRVGRRCLYKRKKIEAYIENASEL